MKRAAACHWARWGLLAWLAGGSILFPATAAAQSRDERAVRAAYVYNLIKYVEWPSHEKDLVIGVAGDAVTGEVVAKLLNGKTSDGQTIRVVLAPSEEELQKCSLLYVADGQTGDARKALERARGRSILTVGETDAFARSGGMIGLVNSGDHIQIEVNLDAAQRAGIRISSRVLNLAVIVEPGQRGGS